MRPQTRDVGAQKHYTRDEQSLSRRIYSSRHNQRKLNRLYQCQSKIVFIIIQGHCLTTYPGRDALLLHTRVGMQFNITSAAQQVRLHLMMPSIWFVVPSLASMCDSKVSSESMIIPRSFSSRTCSRPADRSSYGYA